MALVQKEGIHYKVSDDVNLSADLIKLPDGDIYQAHWIGEGVAPSLTRIEVVDAEQVRDSAFYVESFIHLGRFLIFFVGGSAWNAYVLSVLWNLFLVQVLPVREMTMWVALGIWIPVVFLTYRGGWRRLMYQVSGARTLKDEFLDTFGVPFLFLLIGLLYSSLL